MHDKVVLDSSVIAAIFFPENITGKAIEIAASHDCITVDLAYAEIANVAWKRVRHSTGNADTIKIALTTCNEFISETCTVIPAPDLILSAYELACDHGITVYDALFLAAAIRSGSSLVTADKKLYLAGKKIVKSKLIA